MTGRLLYIDKLRALAMMHYFLIRFINLEFLKEYHTLYELAFITILTIIITYTSMGIGLLVSSSIRSIRRKILVVGRVNTR